MKKRVDNPVNRTADLGYHVDLSYAQRGFKLIADRATDNDIHTEPPQGHNTAVVVDVLVQSVLDDAVLHLEDTETLSHVKNG